MAMSEPKAPRNNRIGKYLYIIIFIMITCVTSVVLSLRGYIGFDPFTALIAGLFAGVAFVMFQLTYLRFVVNSSRRMHSRDPDVA
jgi:hypothetical protein